MTVINNGDTGSAVRTKLNTLLGGLNADAQHVHSSTDGLADMAAIDKVVASVAAVDLFIYDTSKDSDGGAWRKRCQHLSWYNEELNTATRGATREFPAVALIVALTNKVTIYDATDPSVPMWRVHNTTGSTAPTLWYATRYASSVSMKNGCMYVGLLTDSHGGLLQFNYITDYALRTNATSSYGGITLSAATALTTSTATIATTKILVNAVVNDVALTVLPDAPIDQATGLPKVTWAVATNGGVSVYDVHADAVWDSSIASGVASVDITQNGNLVYGGFAGVSGGIRVVGISSISADGFSGAFYNYASIPAVLASAPTNVNGVFALRPVFGLDALTGFNLLKENPTTPASGMVAYVTKSYNTGWMHGDIKGAWVPDVGETSVTGTELVTNGTDWTGATGSTPPTGWVTVSWSGDSSGYTYSIVGGGVSGNAIQIAMSTVGRVAIVDNITTVVGEQYVLSVYQKDVTGGGYINVYSEAGAGGTKLYDSGAITNASWTGYVATFTATSTTSSICLIGSNSLTTLFDSCSVRLAVPDRSVNGNSIGVHGTLALNQVATGSELRAFSGFSASNYLEQPYNSDLDFGTGDFYVMGWVKVAATAAQSQILNRTGSTGSAWQVKVDITTSKLYFAITDDFYSTRDEVTSTSVIDTGSWVCFSAIRSGSNLLVYINGKHEATQAITNAAGSLSEATAKLFIGITAILNLPFEGSLTLPRIGAGAPSAEQIKEIYETEKHMFQANSKITLSGSSNSVLALDYDESTGLLTALTDVQDRFQGLVNVEQDTITGTATSVSTGGGAVLSGSSTTVAYYQPAFNLREELQRQDEARLFYGYQPYQVWFDNLVSNGGFDTDTTGWTASSGATLSVVSNAMRITNGGTWGTAKTTVATIPGQKYLVSSDCNIQTSTSWQIVVYNSDSSIILSNEGLITDASATRIFTAITLASILAIPIDGTNGHYADFDNISVRPCDADGNIIYPLGPGEEPQSVYQEGLLKRKGAAQDYTVGDTGLHKYIIPAVDPGLDDEICVMTTKEYK